MNVVIFYYISGSGFFFFKAQIVSYVTIWAVFVLYLNLQELSISHIIGKYVKEIEHEYDKFLDTTLKEGIKYMW